MRARVPILSVVLLLAGFGLQQATAPVAEAAEPTRAKPGKAGKLWNAFPLDAGPASRDRPRTAPKSATRSFEPPRPPAASASGSDNRIYLTPVLLLLALVFLSTVAWRDVRARRAAAVRRAGRGHTAQHRRTGIRYRD
jgi:hypothetical protein